ncbi:MAG TPA: putative DNA binding domain-containing protein [Anaerolineaceae bacterium]|nr:putative DNA binding domain-containing protein [Anaerolineaceae bacterium]HPN50799.1 putative DNA binding domain-containing protein [Anaerolineaceae bacterium]
MGKKTNRNSMQWYTVDLHLHTPASSDFQQPELSYLEILQRAEQRGLSIIAFTDHNTIAGYRKMMDDLQQLTWLEKSNRLLPEERSRLAEYNRLLNKILVLPAFEFSATFGFHILALFSPQKPVREIEHLLLSLNIPGNQLDEGSATVGATTDVLTAYQMIKHAGGLVIAAHANSSNGVAMRGFNFGGQTKIAYTQDINLDALEVTDLEQKGPRTTAAFFNGTKPEYPRRMHCIQGSDCHRLSMDPARKKNLGVGDRPTDLLLSDLSFEALKDLFTSNDFSRTRPHRHKEEPAFDYLQAAIEEGANIVQSFHDSMTIRGGKLYAIIADTCAFANTNGGTLYIGLSDEPKKQILGVPEVEQSMVTLEKEIAKRITPPLQCSLDIQDYKGKKLIRVLVPRGSDLPYAVDDNRIYIREEAETGLAVRDEIVNLVLRNNQLLSSQPVPLPAATPVIAAAPEEPQKEQPPEPPSPSAKDISPRTGVEILAVDTSGDTAYYTMRDLRNGNIVNNVTQVSARKLWQYAIHQYLEIAPQISQLKIQWVKDLGLVRRQKQGNSSRFDLVQKTPAGYRYFFGVTPDGIHGPWKQLVGEEDN